MRRVLQIIAVSTGGLSILAIAILGVIYIGDMAQSIEFFIKKFKGYAKRIIDSNMLK